MTRTVLLLKAQMYNTFSLNEVFGKESKHKNHTCLIGVSIFLVASFFAVYNVLIATTLVSVSQQSMIPTYMVGVSSFIILGLTFFWSNGILFGSKDYDMLSALPVSSKEIIGSKFIFMYLVSFGLCFLFMIPTGIVWAINSEEIILYFLMYSICTFFVPLIPMCIASLVGILIMWISSRFTHKNIFALLLSLFALVVLFMIGIYSQQSGTSGGNIGVILARQISILYPPSLLFSYQNSFGFIQNGIFIIISLLISWVGLKISSKHYMKIIVLMQKSSVRRNGKIKLIKLSPLISMYKKELGRFFSSYLYVLNATLGLIGLILISFLLCVVPLDVLEKYAGIPDISTFFKEYAPLIIATMVSISCTTSSSVSLEGKNIWILQSIPLSKRTFLGAKIALNMSFHMIAFLLAIVVFSIRFSFTPKQIILTSLVVLSYSIFTSIQGIYFNCVFPKFNWDNEVIVIKQSMSVFISLIVGMIFVAVPALLHLFFKLPLNLILLGMVIVLNIISVLLYQNAYHKKII